MILGFPDEYDANGTPEPHAEWRSNAHTVSNQISLDDWRRSLMGSSGTVFGRSGLPARRARNVIEGEPEMVAEQMVLTPTTISSTSCTPGMIEALTPPGDTHKMAIAGDDLAISIHIYGADIGKLGSSILRRYDQPVA